MSRDNIHERRAYIKSLLDAGQEIDIRGIARMWNSSQPAIVSDIAVCKGNQRPYDKNKEAFVAQNQRAAKLGIDGTLTKEGWYSILETNNYACVRCGSTDDISIDHIIPLSRGGTNTLNNIQPLCRRCNSSKGNR